MKKKKKDHCKKLVIPKDYSLEKLVNMNEIDRNKLEKSIEKQFPNIEFTLIKKRTVDSKLLKSMYITKEEK